MEFENSEMQRADSSPGVESDASNWAASHCGAEGGGGGGGDGCGVGGEGGSMTSPQMTNPDEVPS